MWTRSFCDEIYIIVVEELEDYNEWFKSQEPWLKQNADYLSEVPEKLREVASITVGIENELESNLEKKYKN